jgi:hypothetical protein
VLSDDPTEPGVVVHVGGLPGLAIAKPGIGVGHLRQRPEDEVGLDGQRMLAPERAVGVEHRDALCATGTAFRTVCSTNATIAAFAGPSFQLCNSGLIIGSGPEGRCSGDPLGPPVWPR